jgi:hypothetical protein
MFQAFEELEELLAKKDICIAVKEKLVKDSGVAGEHAYDSIVQKLLTKPRARGESLYHVEYVYAYYIIWKMESASSCAPLVNYTCALVQN